MDRKRKELIRYFTILLFIFLSREKILQKNGKKDSFFRPFPSVIPDAGAHSRKKKSGNFRFPGFLISN